MDKKTISYMKKNYPKLFYFVTKSYFAVRLISELDRFRYIRCMLSKKPYLGALMMAAQTWEERKPFMRQLVKSEIQLKGGSGNYAILEIGSWAGNSAILWAESIKEFDTVKGLVVCVDPWEPYVTDANVGINVAPVIMNKALKKNKIYNLFLHNIKATHNDGIVKPYKGFSDQVLPTLREGLFDLGYVDGSHYYTNIMRDLNNTQKLIRDGGILCGDDLELKKNEVDIENAEKSKERDAIIDTRTKREFHPGVCLAVADFFGGEVSCYEGFWAMRKKGNSWERVVIEIDE